MCWKVFCARQVAFTLPYCVCYQIWTVHLGNYHPMPFIGLCSDLSNILLLLSVKFLIPKEIRNEETFKQQFNIWFVYRIVRILLGYLRLVVSILIGTIPLEFQWITAIIIPTLRSIDAWILSKIVQRTPDTNIQRLQTYVNLRMMILWANFIATRLSSLNDVTVYSILAVELILHIQARFINGHYVEEFKMVSHCKKSFRGKKRLISSHDVKIIVRSKGLNNKDVFNNAGFGKNILDA